MNCARRFGDDQFPTAEFTSPRPTVRVAADPAVSLERAMIRDILANQDLTSGQKCMLIFLATATDCGRVAATIPSKDLGASLGIGRRAVLVQSQSLVKRGWIIKTAQFEQWGGCGPSEYRLGPQSEALAKEIAEREKGGRP